MHLGTIRTLTSRNLNMEMVAAEIRFARQLEDTNQTGATSSIQNPRVNRWNGVRVPHDRKSRL